MTRFLLPILLIVLTSTLAGCDKGPKLIKAKGQLLKDGKNLTSEDDQILRVFFVPIAEDGSPPRNWYDAEVNQDTGAFYARGGLNKGMPPGKYRVGVEVKKNRKDTLDGKFNAVNSPFVFEVDDGSELMIVDIANPPAKS